MKCPDCNFDNPEGMKFCGNCGVPLCNICPSCNHNNPLQFKFCGNCGTPLTPLAPSQALDDLARIQKYIPSYLAEKILQTKGRIEGERRNVTVVFADVSGFTSMSETHDLEEVSTIATICHTMLGKIVWKYEGIVDKIIGDGLMSIFGVPTHENDPERAVMAALEMQQGMMDLSQELWESRGVALGLSAGINTGVVVIGDIGTDLRLDYTVMGDVVNTASRLQEIAEPGEILLTQETYQRAKHYFDFQVLDPVSVRGKRHPVHVYKAIRRKEKPLRARGIEGLSAPLIGRDKELAVCKQVLDQLVAGKGGTLLITGEAGLGKSRLTEEVEKYARSQNIIWLEGKCVSHFRSMNYWVFVDAFRDYFDVKNEDDATEIERKIRKKLTGNIGRNVISTIVSLLLPNLEAENVTDDLAESERKLQIFIAARDILAAESQSRPLILAFEDLHWADELSVELLFFLMENLSQCRVAFVCIYRPPIAGESETQSVQKLEEDHSIPIECTRVVLNPLSGEYSSMLLKSLLTVEDLPSEMRTLILERAGGNPLYLEEVIRSIIDDKSIEQRNGRWLAVKEVEDIEVPSTVQDVIMARIDRLEEEPKYVLQCASVIGRSFEYDLLLYLMPNGRPVTDAVRSSLDEHLEELEDMGFISREDSSEYAFKFRHVLIQNVAYSAILKRRCKKLHEMIGHYIEEAHSRRLDEFYEILAYHYTNSDNIEASLSYLAKAGNKNRKSFTGSVESAFRYFRKALDILSQPVSSPFYDDSSSLTHDDYTLYKRDIYDGIGEVYEDLGEYEMALSSFETVLHIAEQTKDYRAKAKALRQIANNKTQMGGWEAALEAYEESLTIARELGDLPQMGIVYDSIGYGYFERGDLDEAEKYFQKALEIAKQSGDLRLIGDASNDLGTLASIRHDFDEAIRNYQVGLHSYKELGESHYEAQTYLNLGVTHIKKNEIEIADRYYEESLKISEKCGYSRLMTYTYLNRAELYLWQMDLGRAANFCKKAFQILQTLDDKWACAEGYKHYGMIYIRQRDFQSAKEAFRTSLDVSKECDHLPNMAEVHCEMGLIHKEEGTLQKALEHFGKSRDIFEELSIMEEIQKVDEYIAEIKSA